MCVSERKKERECVCVSERKKERECVCVSERKKDIKGKGKEVKTKIK